MTLTAPVSSQDAIDPQTFLIDTDVHEIITDRTQLLPHLDPVWQRHLTELGGVFQGPGLSIPSMFPYTTPGDFRQDWINDEGGVVPASSVELTRRQLLEGEGVSIAILNGLTQMSNMPGNYDFARALASAYNDWQIEYWLDKEPRLRGSIHIVADDPALAAREIDRAAAHPQMVQVFLPTISDRQYGDPRYWPIYEAALRNDLVVTFHHGVHSKTGLGYPRTWFEWHSMTPPHSGQNQILSLIGNGVFEKFPELKAVFLECGVGWLPWFMARADEQYRETRMIIPWVKRLPSEYMRDNIRLSTQPMSDISRSEFSRMIEETRAEDIFMFSTDYPHYDADSVHIVLPESMDESLRLRLRYQNALATYPRLASLA